jgi:hypothetical protein
MWGLFHPQRIFNSHKSLVRTLLSIRIVGLGKLCY